MLHTFPTTQWNAHYSDSEQQQAIHDLEVGQVLYFPELAFSLLDKEKKFLTPEYADPEHKNISYHAQQKKLWGVQRLAEDERMDLKSMLNRFSVYSYGLIKALLPRYTPQLIVARTSFRPLEVSDRKSSYRKDDKRLHVDAFPATPNQGKRIIRVFCNINPNGQPRVWRLGEPFEKVADRFIPKICRPIPGSAALLRMLHITKSYRTDYDHYMLKMHNMMKADVAYQREAEQQEVRFPPGSTWIVQTDQVSHAAMSGQYMLEQTFYLPVKAMQSIDRSPLRILEKKLNRNLI